MHSIITLSVHWNEHQPVHQMLACKYTSCVDKLCEPKLAHKSKFVFALSFVIDFSEKQVPVKEVPARSDPDWEKVEHYTTWCRTTEEREETYKEDREDAEANDAWEDD